MTGADAHTPRLTLLYGGAFDPPHRAHIELPARVRDALGADRILYMPAASPPLKAGPVASAADRIDMLRAALAGDPRAEVSDLEIQRGGASYTIDTLRALNAGASPGETFRLLIGADQALQFHHWKDAREIIELAEPVVMIRPPAETAAHVLEDIAPHWTAAELDAWRSRFIPVPPMDIASTRLRGEIREKGFEAPLACQWLPGAVLEIIRLRGLYAE